MSSLKLSVLAVIGSAALTAGCLYYVHQQRAAEAGAMRAENSRLRLQVVDRARAAARVAAPAPLADEIPIAPAAAPAAGVPGPHDPVVVPDYRNEGAATARAALQTFAWACDQGDVKAVAGMIVFDDAARTKATALFDQLSVDARGSWASVDDMAADLLTLSGMSTPFPGADVLERARLEELSDGRVRLHLNGAPRHGSEFQSTGQGWKYVITESMVDDYIRRSREEQNQP